MDKEHVIRLEGQGQGVQESPIFRRKNTACPKNGMFCHFIEVADIRQVKNSMVMVAGNDRAIALSQKVATFIWEGALTHHISTAKKVVHIFTV